MSVALHGNLRDFGIGEVFQLIGHQRKTGVLEVSGDGERTRIVFEGGSVVSAETIGPYEGFALGDMLVRVGLLTRERRATLEREVERGNDDLPDLLRAEFERPVLDEIRDLVTREAIFALLRRQRGSFHFTPDAVAHGRDPADLLPAEQILMDGLRMVDEWRTLDPSATSEETVFRRVADFDRFRAERPHEPPARLAVAERLFLLIDGRVPVRRVVDLSRLGTFEAARWLSVMREAGLIEPVATRRVTSRMPVARRPARSPVRGLVVALPFLLLLATALLAGRAQVPDGSGGLGADPLGAARLEAGRLRIRHATDATRFVTGSLPAALAELGPVAEEPLRMASERSRPYYYRRRGETSVLLSPAQ